MEVEEPRGPDIPVTILTGFLGAGKTTLLNRILTENHNHRIAIIENEFGQENIDTELIVQSDKEQIISMNNGCVCCTIRGDLSRVLTDLRHKRDRGEIQFDYVVIETTGVANPGPVAQTFFMDDAVAAFYRLDGVVTVVDAKHGPQTLDEEAAARDQVGFADRILLSKCDLVTPEECEALEARLRQMNARAPIRRVDMAITATTSGPSTTKASVRSIPPSSTATSCRSRASMERIFFATRAFSTCRAATAASSSRACTCSRAPT